MSYLLLTFLLVWALEEWAATYQMRRYSRLARLPAGKHAVELSPAALERLSKTSAAGSYRQDEGRELDLTRLPPAEQLGLDDCAVEGDGAGYVLRTHFRWFTVNGGRSVVTVRPSVEHGQLVLTARFVPVTTVVSTLVLLLFCPVSPRHLTSSYLGFYGAMAVALAFLIHGQRGRSAAAVRKLARRLASRLEAADEA